MDYELKRRSFLINRAVNKFLLASVFSAVATQLTVMADAIIVANFVGPDAMSAINVCTPVIAILVNVGYTVSMGSTLLMSKALGEGRKEHGSHVAAVAAALLACGGLVLALTGGAMSESLVAMMCSDEAISAYATKYLRLFFLLDLLPLFAYNAVCSFVEADGSPSVVTRTVIIGGAVNVLLDLLFVAVFHWGISGAMYATVMSNLVVVAILCRHLYRHSNLHFSFPHAGLRRIAKEIKAEGIPLTGGEMVLMVGLLVLNGVIIYSLGSSGMFIWSVCMEILNLVLIAMSGVETSMISIGGFLVGDEDTNGLRLLVRHVLQALCPPLMLLMLLILAVPQWVAMLFGAHDATGVETLSEALRIFSLSIVPLAVIYIMRVVFQLLGHRFASGTMFICQTLLLDAIIGAAALLCPAHVWWAFPLASLLLIAMQLAYTGWEHHRDSRLSALTLIPEADSSRSLDFSVPYQTAALDETLSRVSSLIKRNGQWQHKAADVRLTCEEIMKNIIEHSEGRILKRCFDVHLHIAADKVILVVKDAGEKFNPMEHLPQADAEPDYDHLGLRLIHGACDHLSYLYMWGQNIMTGIFYDNLTIDN